MKFFSVITVESPPKPFFLTGGLWSTWCCDCGTAIVVELGPNEPVLAIMCRPCEDGDVT